MQGSLVTSAVAEVGLRLKELEQTVCVAESSTAGLISASLLAVPGASAFYKGGSVVYTLAARKQILGISKQDVEGLEPLTEPMVLRFAERARAQLDSTWGIAELGVAGPSGAPYGHPPGVSVIGIAGPKNFSTTITTAVNDREANMWMFTAAAIELFASALDQAG